MSEVTFANPTDVVLRGEDFYPMDFPREEVYIRGDDFYDFQKERVFPVLVPRGLQDWVNVMPGPKLLAVLIPAATDTIATSDIELSVVLIQYPVDPPDDSMRHSWKAYHKAVTKVYLTSGLGREKIWTNPKSQKMRGY